jgi:hypothetical protein
MYLAFPHVKKLYNYLFRPGGSSMSVDGRPVYR